MLSSDDIEFTKAWWNNLLQDNDRLIKWLKKLRNTEYAGYSDYLLLRDRFCGLDDRAALRIFERVANDELKHSNLLTDLLRDRGIVHEDLTTSSTYWEQMNQHIVDLKTAAAVNYFGEALAAARFEILVDHPSTPLDIKNVLKIILPEEQFHREAFVRLSGMDTIEEMRFHHDMATSNLRKPKS